jgi:hypothetical protein
MPVAMTYSSLVLDLENYLQRYDDLIINQVPQFIMLAQQRIPRELKLLGFRSEVTGTFNGSTLTDGLMAKPSDWRKTIAFYVGTGTNNNTHTPVFERDYDYIRTVFPDPSETGVPKFYGDADYNHWLIQPTPDAAYPFKIPYYGTLTMLDETTQTNWLTVNAPDLLLYASLLEAVPFVKVDERIQVWQGYYNAAKQALIMQELEGKYDTAAVVGEPQQAPPGP